MGNIDSIQVDKLFDFWTRDELEKVQPFLEEAWLEKGETLFQPGDRAESVYFLLRGRLAVQTKTGFKNKMQVVALLEQGAMVGEGGVLENRNRNTTVIAIEDSRLVGFSREKIKDLELKAPDIVIKLFRRLLEVTNLRLLKVSERLAHVM